MLQAKNLSVFYEDYQALRDFSLSIKQGEILTIIGPNGSGKSTALRALARLHPYKNGVVYLNGVDMKSMKSWMIARTLGVVTQTQTVPPDMTVEELIGRGRTPHHSLFMGMSSEDRRIVAQVLEETKLEAYKDRSIYALSGGERQRTFIAMMLAQQPSIFLLDEPTTYLDICFQFEILELLRKLNRGRKLTIVMVLHDINQAARYSDRLAVMKDGKLWSLGTPREIITETMMQDVYGMHVRIVNEESTGSPYLIPIRIV